MHPMMTRCSAPIRGANDDSASVRKRVARQRALREATPAWQRNALLATNGSHLGAILRCALGVERNVIPRFNGRASLTSDGYLLCDFTDRNGFDRMGAFVGSLQQLRDNISGLAEHLRLTDSEAQALRAIFAQWIVR
jgi:hypothetical protein